MAAVELFSFTQNMSGATVVEWLVDDGADVEAGEDLVEVESEKAVQVIPAPIDGVVSIEVPEGEQVDVGTTLATIHESAAGDGGAAAADEATTADDSPTPAVRRVGAESGGAAEPPADGDRVRASPAARHLARGEGVSLAALAGDGAGPDGAVVKRDVAAAVEDGTAGTSGTETGRSITERREPGGLRRTVAERMTASAREIPQVTLHRTVTAEPLLRFTDRLTADLAVDVSVEAFVVAAAADALVDHPGFNAICENGTHKLAGAVNVGVAVDVDRGLVTPVLRNASELGLVELHRERRRLIDRVHEGAYSMADLSDGTFTVTNLGAFDVEAFDPLVNPPEVAILGVGAVSAVLDPETGDPVRCLPLSLTFDHRPNDGADAARFLDAIADGLRHPLRLLGDPV